MENMFIAYQKQIDKSSITDLANDYLLSFQQQMINCKSIQVNQQSQEGQQRGNGLPSRHKNNADGMNFNRMGLDQKVREEQKNNQRKSNHDDTNLATFKSNSSLLSPNYIRVRSPEPGREDNISTYIEKLKIYEAFIPPQTSKNGQEVGKERGLSRQSNCKNPLRNRQTTHRDQNNQNDNQKRSPKFSRKRQNPYTDIDDAVDPIKTCRFKERTISERAMLQQKTDRIDDNFNGKFAPTISQMRKEIENRDNHIKQLESQISHTIPALRKKIKEQQQVISSLQQRINFSEKDKEELTQKIEDLIAEPEFCKASLSEYFEACNDDQAGTLQSEQVKVASNSQLIDSLSNMESELQKKVIENHYLLKSIDQLKIKLHCHELKHAEQLKNVARDWKKKYDNLKQFINCPKKDNRSAKKSREEPNCDGGMKKKQFPQTELEVDKFVKPFVSAVRPESVCSDRDSLISLEISLQSAESFL